MRSTHILILSVAVAAAAILSTFGSNSADAAGVAVSREEADGIIFERQNIMLQLEKDAELLGEIAAGIKPADKLAEVTRSIAESAAASKAAFEPHVPGGRSKPEVWTNWTDYSRRLDEFDKNARQLAELGAKGDLTAVTNMLGSALPCKECHDLYRAAKKAS